MKRIAFGLLSLVVISSAGLWAAEHLFQAPKDSASGKPSQVGLAEAATTADPAAICQAAKLKAMASTTARVFRCESTAAENGAAVDQTCVATAIDRLAPSFSKAEAKGSCTTTGDESTVEGKLDAFVADVSALLRPNQLASTCAASKLKLTGTHAAKLLALYAKNKRRPDPGVLTRSIHKIKPKFLAAFDGTETKGNCITTGDEAAVEGRIDSFVADITALLYPWDVLNNGTAAFIFPPKLLPQPPTGDTQVLLTQPAATSSSASDAGPGAVSVEYLDNPTNLSISDFMFGQPPQSNLFTLAQDGTSTLTLPGGNIYTVFLNIAAFNPYDVYAMQCPGRIVKFVNTGIDAGAFHLMLDSFHC